jgi:DMSO/TMAO reductase YedYZ molybdopterin-dependent catalytic subunit
MPKIESHPTLVCPGFFTDVAAWAGVPLKSILEQAVVLPDATGVRLNSADGYSATITLREALSEENYLAYEWEGEPLPILHGFPVRAVFPHLQGNTWVKWLISIELY